MNQWELAQLNIAQAIAPLDSPELADFMANLDRINSLADASAGFIWRLKDDWGDATGCNQPFGDNMVVNMSVWESIEALHNYVYQSAHTEVMRRRKDWFESSRNVAAVLWWVPQGHIPDLLEAQTRLNLLAQVGPSQDAFTFKNRMGYPQGN